jgi:MFS family permease
MYPRIRENLPNLPEDPPPGPRRPPWYGVRRNVLYLGFTSLFTDISSEMVSSVLPLYLMFYLRLTPLEFGAVDGLYQGVASLVRVAGGLTADRWRRHKEVAAFGYALSAICKLGLLAAGSAWGALAAVILIDRTGKGVRTAPRDALISLSSPRAALATAFGVHRTLDTAGAMLGPLVAFALLTLMPGAFDVVFVVSFCAALVGLGLLVLFVENQRVVDATQVRRVSVHAMLGLLAAPRFRALVFVGAALSLATISDGFLYLRLQRGLAFNAGFFPLLAAATALVYLLLAVPAGHLADRLGRSRVYLGGYVLLLLAYGALWLPAAGGIALFGSLALLGAYYAATDGVLMALASAVLPTTLRTSGLALLTTATSLARLLASVLFGALWTAWGVETAVIIFMMALSGAILLSTVILIRTEHSAVLEAAATSRP